MARAVPAILAGQNPTLLIRELVAELAVREPERAGAIADTRMLSAADRVFASLACHSARRAGGSPGRSRAGSPCWTNSTQSLGLRRVHTVDRSLSIWPEEKSSTAFRRR